MTDSAHRSNSAREPSLGPVPAAQGIGLALSASDIETYRSCPLRYKFARVLRIPTEQTLHQRFGIAVHQVLERYHSEGAQTLGQMLDAARRRLAKGRLRRSERERRLRREGTRALTRYHARLLEEDSEPVWFERPFAFRLGPHHLRGRVDRVDRLGPGASEEYELIDYKTSRPKTATQLKRRRPAVPLRAGRARSLAAGVLSPGLLLRARRSARCPFPDGEKNAESVKDTVLEVGEGILAQEFEPTPFPCGVLDLRLPHRLPGRRERSAPGAPAWVG